MDKCNYGAHCLGLAFQRQSRVSGHLARVDPSTDGSVFGSGVTIILGPRLTLATGPIHR